jgi:ABC-type transport system substrate-binding protein
VQTPQLGTRFVVFNTARGPFTNARLRRAVSYAIDRRALAGVVRDVPSDSLLPPGLAAAASPKRVYPLSPNLARARTLAHGFRGTVVLYTCMRPDCAASSRILRANLASLGMRVKIMRFDDPFSEALEPGAKYDLLTTSWFYDWPDPAEVLNAFLGARGYKPEWVPQLVRVPPSFRRDLDRASLLRGEARIAAYRRLSVELASVVAPFAAYGTPLLPEFFSARMDCRVEQPIVGAVDIGALCVSS